MSKITELKHLIGPGARTNKYRIVYPVLGKDIDILCHSTQMPGADIGVAEVYLRGRKFQLAGDRIDDGRFEITIYNTEDLLVRTFFLTLLESIQNYKPPDTFSNTVGNIAIGNLVNTPYNFIGNGFGINMDYLTIAYTNWNTIYNAIQNFTNIGNYYSNTNAWYMSNITVQQLDHNGEVSRQMILENAFITTVGPIDYTDETGDISSTTLTFAYSGISYS